MPKYVPNVRVFVRHGGEPCLNNLVSFGTVSTEGIPILYLCKYPIIISVGIPYRTQRRNNLSTESQDQHGGCSVLLLCLLQKSCLGCLSRTSLSRRKASSDCTIKWNGLLTACKTKRTTRKVGSRRRTTATVHAVRLTNTAHL